MSYYTGPLFTTGYIRAHLSSYIRFITLYCYDAKHLEDEYGVLHEGIHIHRASNNTWDANESSIEGIVQYQLHRFIGEDYKYSPEAKIQWDKWNQGRGRDSPLFSE